MKTKRIQLKELQVGMLVEDYGTVTHVTTIKGGNVNFMYVDAEDGYTKKAYDAAYYDFHWVRIVLDSEPKDAAKYKAASNAVADYANYLSHRTSYKLWRNERDKEAAVYSKRSMVKELERGGFKNISSARAYYRDNK